jgi:hypothetical protein
MRVPWSDPRVIFPLVAGAIALGLLVHVKQPIEPQESVVAVHDYIQQLPKGSAVLLAVDFDPQAMAELRPMTEAIIEQCLDQDLHVVGMTFWPLGAQLGYDMFKTVADEPRFRDKEAGRDYVYLGYKPGDLSQVITNMGENLLTTFPQDYRNRPTGTMPIFRDVKSLRNVKYIIDLAAGSTPDAWIIFGGDKYNVPMAVGCTAISGPDLYVRLKNHQINGLVAGLRGAADYETLLQKAGLGVGGMFAQSLIHVMIVLFVIAGNVAFFVGKRRQRRRG